jgi:NADH-quinone oxidoreductase subunit C
LKAEDIKTKIDEKFPGKVIDFPSDAPYPFVEVDPASLFAILSHLKSEDGLEFDELMSLSGVDYGAENELGITYHLCSMGQGHKIAIKVKIPRENPEVASVGSLWRTAEWHEREAYDLFGIAFEDHPDLTRILLPDDWDGHPLRKDYVVNKVYQGIRFKD